MGVVGLSMMREGGSLRDWWRRVSGEESNVCGLWSRSLGC